jgi:putative membrane protein
MTAFLFQIIAGILGTYLSAELIPGVQFVGERKIFLLIGLIFGIINYFIKPILNFFLFPVRLLTFGLIGIVINIAIVWFVSFILFPDNFKIFGIVPLIITTLIIWASSFFFYLLAKRSWRKQRHDD